MEKGSYPSDRLCRIAVTGPESTGKSALAESLAEYFHTVWVPEYARTYLEKLGRAYAYEDIVEIARGQMQSEEEKAAEARNVLVCDTELLVTKIWSTFKFQQCDPWILEQMKKPRYDVYLLCDIDLPWQQDPLREHPGQRKELFQLYLNELKMLGIPFGIVRGTGADRLKNALNIITVLTGISC